MRRHSIFFILLLVLLLDACSSTKQSIPEQGTMVGKIFVIGNEPFTKLAIQTSENLMFPLKCEKKIETELQAIQGKIIKVKYDGTKPSPEGLMLIVTNVELPSDQ